jgi:hypothetical protein
VPKCEWRDEGQAKCGRPGYQNRSYCSDHVWLIYQKGTGYKGPKAKNQLTPVVKPAIVHEQ